MSGGVSALVLQDVHRPQRCLGGLPPAAHTRLHIKDFALRPNTFDVKRFDGRRPETWPEADVSQVRSGSDQSPGERRCDVHRRTKRCPGGTGQRGQACSGPPDLRKIPHLLRPCVSTQGRVLTQPGATSVGGRDLGSGSRPGSGSGTTARSRCQSRLLRR